MREIVNLVAITIDYQNDNKLYFKPMIYLSDAKNASKYLKWNGWNNKKSENIYNACDSGEAPR